MNPTPPLQLERIRRATGITIEQIALTTKIGANFLRAIESGEFEKLPGGIFDTNFIRQYAEAIDMDPQDILEQYRSYVEAREIATLGAEVNVPQVRSRWRDWFRSEFPAIRS